MLPPSRRRRVTIGVASPSHLQACITLFCLSSQDDEGKANASARSIERFSEAGILRASSTCSGGIFNLKAERQSGPSYVIRGHSDRSKRVVIVADPTDPRFTSYKVGDDTGPYQHIPVLYVIIVYDSDGPNRKPIAVCFGKAETGRHLDHYLGVVQSLIRRLIKRAGVVPSPTHVEVVITYQFPFATVRGTALCNYASRVMQALESVCGHLPFQKEMPSGEYHGDVSKEGGTNAVMTCLYPKGRPDLKKYMPSETAVADVIGANQCLISQRLIDNSLMPIRGVELDGMIVEKFEPDQVSELRRLSIDKDEVRQYYIDHGCKTKASVAEQIRQNRHPNSYEALLKKTWSTRNVVAVRETETGKILTLHISEHDVAVEIFDLDEGAKSHVRVVGFARNIMTESQDQDGGTRELHHSLLKPNSQGNQSHEFCNYSKVYLDHPSTGEIKANESLLDKSPSEKRAVLHPFYTESPDPSSQCPYCNKNFSGPKGLRSHIFHPHRKDTWACKLDDNLKRYNEEVLGVRYHKEEYAHLAKYKS